jgi:hypothetical protein
MSATTSDMWPMGIVSRTSWYPVGTTVRTGEKCPESGSWTVVGHDWISASISAGQIMPRYLGKDATWRLVHYGL